MSKLKINKLPVNGYGNRGFCTLVALNTRLLRLNTYTETFEEGGHKEIASVFRDASQDIERLMKAVEEFQSIKHPEVDRIVEKYELQPF